MTRIAGLPQTASQRAFDMLLKVQHVQRVNGGRGVVFATGTPIANSVTEAFVMQRYLRPDLLDAAGIGSFYAWAATFGQTVTQMEMSPTGAFRLKTRFAKFQNVPEMLRMWSVFADVKTAADLDLPIPTLAERDDGQRAAATVPVEPTVELERFVGEVDALVGDRADGLAAQVHQAHVGQVVGLVVAAVLSLIHISEPTRPY